VTEKKPPEPDFDLAVVMEAVTPDSNCKDCHGTGIFDWKKKHGREGQEPCFRCCWDAPRLPAERLAHKFIEQGRQLEQAKLLLREGASFYYHSVHEQEEWRRRTREFLSLNDDVIFSALKRAFERADGESLYA